jgi:hypothetical protein
MKIGLFVRAVREPEKVNKKKNLKKKDTNVIFHLCVGAETPEGGSMKFCTFVESLDVIKCANFHVYLMINLRARWGSKNELFPLKCIWLLLHCLALPRWQVKTRFVTRKGNTRTDAV